MMNSLRFFTVCLLAHASMAHGFVDELPASGAQVIHDGDIVGDQFGRSVAIIGDVDGDGMAEYAVGMRGNISGLENAGRVVVYSGATDEVLWSVDGESAFDHFTEAIARAGDIDQDGFGDLIVGAWSNDGGGAESGRAYVYSGADGSLLFIFTGLMPGDNMGDSVAGAGDINNDGFNDLLVGAPTSDVRASNTGSVTVFSGKDGSVLYTKHGENANDRLGVCVAGIGDVDGDGFDDFAGGAHLFDNGGGATDNRGMISVFSGATGEIIYSLIGEGAGDNFGWAVSGVGDVNNDGQPDIVVGAPLNDALGSNTGRVYVYSGPDGELLHMFTGERAVDKLGLTVAPAGDMDNDGYDDILTGAWWYDISEDSSDNRGRAYVFSGQTGETLFTITGEQRRDHLGRPVAGGDDINGDGVPDIIAGARDSDANGEDAGRVYVFHMPGACLADLTGDGDLNFFDISEFLALFAAKNPLADFTGDGSFNFFDVSTFLQAFGKGCP